MCYVAQSPVININDRLLFARVEIGVAKFPTKTAKNDYFFFVSEIFFQSGCASLENNVIFLHIGAKKLTLGRGVYNFKTG